MVWLFVIGVVCALVFGLVYGVLCYLLPFVDLFLMPLVGYGIGRAVGFGGKVGKVRWRKFVKYAGYGVGVVLIYFSWVAWANLNSEGDDFLYSFGGFGREMVSYADEHFSSGELIRNDRVIGVSGDVDLVSGVLNGGVNSSEDGKLALMVILFMYSPYVMWLCEFGGVVWMAGYYAEKEIGGLYFCESCGEWMDGGFVVDYVDGVDGVDNFRKDVEGGRLDALNGLRDVGGYRHGHFVVDVSYCLGCDGDRVFSLDESVGDADGKEHVRVVEGVILPGEVADRLGEKFCH